MYRQIFRPTETNNQIPFIIPKEWYGMNLEITVCPVSSSSIDKNNVDKEKKRKRKRKEILKKYSFSRNGYKFDREEAND